MGFLGESNFLGVCEWNIVAICLTILRSKVIFSE